MKILRLVRLRTCIVCLLPLVGVVGLLIALGIRSRGAGMGEEAVMVIVPPTYLSPLVKQFSSMDQCREWEQREQAIKRMMELFRQRDKEDINRVMQLELKGKSKMLSSAARSMFYQVTSSPSRGVCHNLRKVGGTWVQKEGANDGGKFVCFDDLDIWADQGKCLVYSFGISTDWTFEDQMDQLGCTVHAFDPTVDYGSSRGRGIHFTRLGLADRHTKLADGAMGTAFTLDTIMTGNNHSNSVINYLKVDIEGWEVGALEQWIVSGSLTHVRQFGLELHTAPVFYDMGLDPVRGFTRLLTSIQNLYTLGFRLVSYEPNLTAPKTNGYYQFFELVFMRDVFWN